MGAVLAVVTTTGAVAAHESRDVGDNTIVVGFANEPVYTGQKSGLEFLVTRGEEPIEGLEETLQATVTFGDESRDLEISPRFGEPGWYESVFFRPRRTLHVPDHR